MQKYKNDSEKDQPEDSILRQAKLKMDLENGLSNNQDKVQSKKKNTKPIVIGITTCVFLSILGYAILKETQEDSLGKYKQAKTLRILATEDEIAYQANLESDQEVQALILRNQEQNERIKVLQGDISQLTQRLNELKTNFFATDIEGQQQKIAELERDLNGKEDMLKWFIANMSILDEELAKTRQSYRELQQDVLTQFSLDLETQLELVKEYNPVQGKKLRFIKDVLNQATQELSQQKLYQANREFILEKMMSNPKNIVFAPFEKKWKKASSETLSNVSNLISALHYHLEINPTLDADAKIELYNLHDHRLANQLGMLNAGIIDLKKEVEVINMLKETRRAIQEQNQSVENRYAFAHRKHLNNRYYLTTLQLENSILTSKVMISSLKSMLEGLPQNEAWTNQLTRQVNILNFYMDNLKLELAREEILKDKAKVAEIQEKFNQKKRLDQYMTLVAYSMDDIIDNSLKILGKAHNLLALEYGKNNFHSIGYLAALDSGDHSVPLVYEGYAAQTVTNKGPTRNALSQENLRYKEELQKLKKELNIAKKEVRSLHKQMVAAQEELILKTANSASQHTFTVPAYDPDTRKDLEMQVINSEATIRRLQTELEQANLALKSEQEKSAHLEKQIAKPIPKVIPANAKIVSKGKLRSKQPIANKGVRMIGMIPVVEDSQVASVQKPANENKNETNNGVETITKWEQ